MHHVTVFCLTIAYTLYEVNPGQIRYKGREKLTVCDSSFL